MKKKKFILMIIFQFLFFLSQDVWSDVSVQDDIKALQQQMDKMQKKLELLEKTVVQQESTIAQQDQDKQSYEKRIQELEFQLNDSGKLGSMTPVDKSRKLKWVPEIGMIADVVAKINSPKTDEEGDDRVSVREVELVLGDEVDPFSRLDATIAFSDEEDPSLEEAYLTRFELPWEATARLGKFKPKVGKAIALHRDSLETVDEPLVIQKYFGIEGFNKSGVDFSKILNLPWPVSQQLNVGILEGGNGEEGTAFGETKRRPTFYSHLKNYIDLTPEAGLELGVSHSLGSRDEDSRLEVQIFGVDATLIHQVNPRQRIKLQGEVFNLSREETVDFDGNLWGYYALADWKFSPRWSTGFRFDNVQIVDNDLTVNSQKEDEGYTGYITFHQSEFARWRLQGSHTKLITGKNDNAVMLQGTFSIGEHKHKIQ